MNWMEQADIPCISFYDEAHALIGGQFRSHYAEEMKINPNQWYYWGPEYDLEIPMVMVSQGKLIRVKAVELEDYRQVIEVTELRTMKTLFEGVFRRNRYSEVTPELQRLGITRRLVEQIPVGHQFFGAVEWCMCGVEDCFRREAWIIRFQDGFVVPFCYRVVMPSSWLEHRLEKCEPDHGFNIDYAHELAEEKDYAYFEERDLEFPLPALMQGYKIPSNQINAFNLGNDGSN
ncbi:hypothetical protein KIH41_17190 [Litoribacter ruber]|uniref:hypothetical protein n=1 Tax=Litoribacter ruber TaxID=702568 RepID=UPI001BD9753E|nr:hypothetical protein [Litoribacter ruber]MBT0813026.1 hypothetical protein [Litoribacter ruber]